MREGECEQRGEEREGERGGGGGAGVGESACPCAARIRCHATNPPSSVHVLHFSCSMRDEVVHPGARVRVKMGFSWHVFSGPLHVRARWCNACWQARTRTFSSRKVRGPSPSALAPRRAAAPSPAAAAKWCLKGSSGIGQKSGLRVADATVHPLSRHNAPQQSPLFFAYLLWPCGRPIQMMHTTIT